MTRRAIAGGAVVLGLAAASVSAAVPRPNQKPDPSGRDGGDPALPSPERPDSILLNEISSVRQGYLIALQRLASGSSADAVELLIAFEERLADQESGLPLRSTERDEKEVLAGLAAQDSEAVLPILLLHVDTFRRHQQQGNQPFADHHAAMAVRIAGHLAAVAGTPAELRAAAEPLAAVGLALLEERRRTAAQGILLAAREIDPENADALLGLAIDREWEGDAEQVVTLLHGLPAATAPAEARLRLAVNLRRTERHGEAAELLSALLREPAEAWVAQLAHQELAALRIAGGQPDEAVLLLRAGIDRFPDSERILIQLAYALDRAGDPAAARETVAVLASRPTGDGAGIEPRRRYNRSLEAGTALALPALRERAVSLLPRLAAALETLAAEGARR